MNVIVLDGNQRSALAVTRSLGKRGIKVTVGAETLPSLASSSRYCSQGFLYPSPYNDPNEFLQAIKEVIVSKSDVILLPMTDIALSIVLKERSQFDKNVSIPFVDYDTYISVSDKANLLKAARDINIPIPKTLFSSEFGDMERLIADAEAFGFPLVIKPFLSRISSVNKWIDAGVRYAANNEELRAILKAEPFRSFPFVIQERICGTGIGIFLLMKNGEVLAQFAHRRLREKPPSGGVSVLCESIEPPQIALDAGVKLLKRINWSGVAMVEFKLDDRDNTPKLMEVNARFWGSLQLAVSAGVDFPYLLYRIAKNESVDAPGKYKVGIRSRWELGDLDHLLIRLKKTPEELFLPVDALSKSKLLATFIIDFLRASVKSEVFRPEDMLPFFFETKKYIRDAFRSI